MIRQAIIRWLRLDERYVVKASLHEHWELADEVYRSFDFGSGLPGSGSLVLDREAKITKTLKDKGSDAEPA